MGNDSIIHGTCGAFCKMCIRDRYLFVPDFDETVASLMEITDEKGDPVAELHWFYGFDLDCDDNTQILVQNQIESGLGQLEVSDQAELTVGCEGVAKDVYKRQG